MCELNPYLYGMKNANEKKAGFAAHIERAKQIRLRLPSLSWNEAQKAAAALARFETLSAQGKEFIVSYIKADGKITTRVGRNVAFGYTAKGMRQTPAHQKNYWDVTVGAVRSFVIERLIECRRSIWS